MKKPKSLALLLTVVGLVSLPAAAVPVLHLTPSATTVTQGDQVAVDVTVSGLSDELIGAYDLTIGWDPGFLSFSGLEFGTLLDGPVDSIQGFSPISEGVNVFEVSLGLLANQSGFDPFRLFTLNFNALGAGTASLFFSANAPQIVGDELGGEYLGVSQINTNIVVRPAPASVPEPASLGLMILGIGALLAARRRKVSQVW